MTWTKGFATAPEGYTYREFRPEDGAMEGVEITHAIIGGTMEKDGVPVAYGGFNLIGGRHWVFFFIKDDSIRNHGLWVARLIRDSVRSAKAGGIHDLYALCDTTKPRAPEFLRFLGFSPMHVYDKPVDVILYERMMGAKAWHRTEGK